MDATSLVKKRFNELATRAQEAGVKLAAQVKDQQHRLANRNSSKGQEQTEAAESEQETALRLVQFQNKALRDRLRSTAIENERLHELLKEYRASGPQGHVVKESKENVPDGEQTSLVEQLEERVKGFESERERMRKTIDSLEADLKEERERYAANMDDMERKHRAEMADAQDRKLEEHVDDLSKASSRLVEVEEELSTVQNERDDLRVAVKELNERIGRLEESVVEQEEQAAVLKRDVDSKNDRIQSLESEAERYVATSTAEKEAMEAQVASYRAELEDAHKKLSEPVPDAPACCKKCEDMDALLVEKDQLMMEASSAIQRAISSEGMVDELKQALETAKHEFAAKRSVLDDTIAQLRRELSDQKEINNSLEEDLASLKRDEQQEDAIDENSTSRIAELEALLHNEQSKFEEYKSSTQEKLSNLEEMLSTGTQAVEEVNRLHQLLKESEARLAEEKQRVVSETEDQSTPTPSYDTVMGDTMIDLKNQNAALEAALADSEKTHELRDKATQILKDEVAELKRMQKRNAVDVDYLKAVLVKSFACGELDSKSHIFDVISRLLQFSPQDVESARAHENQPSHVTASIDDMFNKLANLMPTSTG
ncbi:hypothetical protein M9435_005793 [Picochlorum sp. BPE23]|nr:hypothetical protein M9435_005793 [Picochlorum sp. BPE23]